VPDLVTPTHTTPALALTGVTYAYPTASAAALREVSIALPPGEFALLAGRSASGKSTLLRAACGLVPHFHGGEIEGGIEVAGIDAIAAGPGELAAVVGYVAQDPETQVVSTTVSAEIELPLEMRGDPPASRARAVEEVALALAIPHLLDRAVDTLSGGELQRVALAAALVTRPRLVLLDEPTSQLDPVAGDELIWLLRRLNEEWGVTILLAEHRLERCLAAADRVIAMASGSIAYDGNPRDFLTWAQNTEILRARRRPLGADASKIGCASAAVESIAIVMSSALPEQSVRERFDDFDAYMQKPYEMDLLLNRLAELAARTT